MPTGWTRVGAAGLATVASDRAHRGTNALKLGAAVTGARRMTHSMTGLTPTGSHWGRLWFSMQAPVPTPPAGTYLHATFVALRGTSPNNNDGIEIRVVDTVGGPTGSPQAGRYQFLYNVQPDNRGEFGNDPAYNYTYTATWTCVEWNVDNANQRYRFFLNGVEVPGVGRNNGAGNFNGTEIPAGFATVAVGLNNYVPAPAGGLVAWIDDFAINSTQIGCGP